MKINIAKIVHLIIFLRDLALLRVHEGSMLILKRFFLVGRLEGALGETPEHISENFLKWPMLDWTLSSNNLLEIHETTSSVTIDFIYSH